MRQDRAAGQGPQLPGGQPRRRPDDQFLHRGGGVVQAGQFLRDDLRTAFVDQPGGQRGAGQQEAVQLQGQVQQPPGASPGQRQRDRDLIIGVIKRPPVPRHPARRLTAGRKRGDGGELRHGGPRGQPVRGLQHPGPLIIIQRPQPLTLHQIHQRGQHRIRREPISPPPVRERGTLSRIAVTRIMEVQGFPDRIAGVRGFPGRIAGSRVSSGGTPSSGASSSFSRVRPRRVRRSSRSQGSRPDRPGQLDASGQLTPDHLRQA